MLFNSLQFAGFFILVFTCYWLAGTKRLTTQNTLLVAASYYFYCSWNWRFGILLGFSTLLDFYSARAIAASIKHKKSGCMLLLVSTWGCWDSLNTTIFL